MELIKVLKNKIIIIKLFILIYCYINIFIYNRVMFNIIKENINMGKLNYTIDLLANDKKIIANNTKSFYRNIYRVFALIGMFTTCLLMFVLIDLIIKGVM